MHNKKGFTLVESVIVLACMSVLMGLGYLIHNGKTPTAMLKKRIDTILSMAHQESILYHRRVEINIQGSTLVVNGERSQNYLLEHVSSIKGSDFYFNDQGHISKSQTWIIYLGNSSFSIIFYLGTGQYVIK